MSLFLEKLFTTEPLIFTPLFHQRIWGGRRLAQWGFDLPPGVSIGEIWSLSDRADAQSILLLSDEAVLVNAQKKMREDIAKSLENLAHRESLENLGVSLHQLWQDVQYRQIFFGQEYLTHPSERFPLLIKLLDAAEPLSLQVHPPEEVAALFGGEAKTECWYVLEAEPGAMIHVGLRQGARQEDVVEAIGSGEWEQVLHTIPVHQGESFLLPSGRLHSLGEGVIVVEVQQNSDTTYRVFDWNRYDAQGQPRELHSQQALASINFEDWEPLMQPPEQTLLADTPYFHVEKQQLTSATTLDLKGRFALLILLHGELVIREKKVSAGMTALIPAFWQEVELTPATEEVLFLIVRLPFLSEAAMIPTSSC